MRAGQRLFEREAVLARLVDLAASVEAGEGRVATVVAPAGLGKSSLLDALVRGLRATGPPVLAATGAEQERSLAHGVTRSLLTPALQEPSVRARVLTGAAAPVAALLDGAPLEASAPGIGAEHALYWTVANLAEDRSLVLVVDDAHWVDDASLAFLGYLARRVRDLPVLLVLAMRPSAQTPWPAPLAGQVFATDELDLLPLSPDAVRALVAAGLRDAGTAFADACGRATGGNPLYLVQLVADVRRRGLAPTDANAPLVEGIAPPAIVRSVLLRVAGQGEEAVALARACAVLGDGCRLDHAAALAGLEADAAADAADRLTSAGVLAPGALRFVHPVLRAAVLGDLGAHTRGVWHARAAAVLGGAGAPAPVVATHLLAAPPLADPAVAHTLLDAAREARASGSPGTAAGLLRRALDEPPPREEVDTYTFELGLAEASSGESGALDHLVQGIEQAREPAARAERSVVFAELARKVGLAEQAVDALDGALAALPPDDPTTLATAVQRYWVGRTTSPTYPRVRSDRDVLGRGLGSPDEELARTCAAFLAVESLLAGDRDAAGGHLDRARRPGLLDLVDPDSNVVGAVLISLALDERHAELAALADEVVERAGRDGNRVASILVACWRGLDLLHTGRFAEAEAEVGAALELSAELGWPGGSPELGGIQALARLRQGDLAGAQQALRDSPFDLTTSTTPPGAVLPSAHGEVLLALEDPPGALACHRAAGECLVALDADHPGLLDWRSPAVAALRRTGDLGEARRLAEEGVDLADRVAGPAARAGARRTLATVVDPETALAVLGEARSLVSGAPFLQAAVAADLGAALRRAGHRTEARELLRTAVDLATRLHAVPLADRAREELLAAGGRPRRTALTGLDALTAAELRVVRLAASGSTNTVIAQSLFVSRKTVEKHLANAYAKLGITSRAALADLDV